jgi:KaiC/GvpD/RAD55 family RecA-like ATPase
VIDDFNAAHNMHQLLKQYGFKQTGKNRFLSPNSTTRLAGVNVFDDGRAYSHHASDPFDEEHSFDCFELFCQFEHSGSVKDAVKDAAALLKHPQVGDPFANHPSEPVEEAKPLFKRIGLEAVRPPSWLVKNHIEEATFVMVFGQSGAKKSFLVYDLSCCVASGKDWHGHRVKQGSVLIICGEGHGGLNRRLKGWEKHNDTSLADVPLYGNERPLILTEDADIDALIAYIEGRISIDGTPALIVVDTLARALGAADEKSGADINKLIVALTNVIQQYKCSVLLVHHTGHSEAAQHRARGASDLPAAVDHEFRVEKHDEEGLLPATLLTNTKSKDAALVEPVLFDMINVGLGVCDEDMIEIDTLVPELRGPVGDTAADTTNPITVVVDEDRRLRRKGDVKRADLVKEVYVSLDGSRKQAERWVRRAIERGEIDDFPR